MKKMTLLLAGLFILATAMAYANPGVEQLPIAGFTQTMNATVTEQVDIIDMPNLVTWDVTNIGVTTDGTANGTFQYKNIVLVPGNKLEVAIKANAPTFTPPAAGTTYNASDVSWDAGTWTNGTGAAGTLSDTTFNQVAVSNVNASTFNGSTTFTLAANTGIVNAGTYSITANYRLQSIP